MTSLNIAALIVVGIFAAGLIIVGFSGMIRPDRFAQWVQSLLARPSGWVIAAVFRAVLGVALLVAATVSALPLTFKVLGWLALFGAVFVIVFRHRLSAFMDRLIRAGTWPMRLACTAAGLMGIALIYGVVPAS